MDVWSRLRRTLSGRSALTPGLADRHARREAARERHRETGKPFWTSEDRHLGPRGERSVADVAPGTPGHFGSVRSIEDD